MVHGGSGKLELTGSLGESDERECQTGHHICQSACGGIWIWHQNCSKMRISISMRRRAIERRPQCGRYAHTALISCLSGRKVRSDVAMTGEISLHGQVLPIGGLKRKKHGSLPGRHGAGAYPQENAPDLYEVDEAVKQALVFKPVTQLEEVLKTALLPKQEAVPVKRQARAAQSAPGGKRAVPAEEPVPGGTVQAM